MRGAIATVLATMKHARVVSWVLSVVVGGCTLYKPVPMGVPGTQTRQALDTTVPHHVAYKYLLYLPKSYDPTKTYPLVLFLHGAGERGVDVDKVRAWGPPKLVDAGQQFEFILAAPQCPEGQWWHVDDLEVLLDDLVAQYPVDRSRLYLTGLSMGGCATWDWVLRDPEKFAAAVPVCGWGNPTLVSYARPVTPVWAFHGDADKVISVEGSKVMVEAWRKLGRAETRLTIYPKVGHNSWSAAYGDPEVFPWMMRQKLATTRPVK